MCRQFRSHKAFWLTECSTDKFCSINDAFSKAMSFIQTKVNHVWSRMDVGEMGSRAHVLF